MSKPKPVKIQPAVQQRYEALAAEFLRRPDVTRAGAGFGAKALKVRGRIFATLSTSGEFIVKLPESRVDAYVANGDGVRSDGGKGRQMKEWLSVSPDSEVPWSRLAQEAMDFVGRR